MAQPCPDDDVQPARSGPVPLPLLSTPPPRKLRQGLTCLYRCGNACAHEPPNKSGNEYFGAVLEKSLSRRGVLRAGAVLTVAAGATGLLSRAAPSVALADGPTGGEPPVGLRYETVPVNTDDVITLPPGYDQNIVIRWGDPVVPGAPEFDFNAQTAEAQAGQFGYNNDFCGLLRLSGDAERYLMFNNHEYTIEPLMHAGYDEENPTEEQYRIGLAGHGLTVVVIERDRATGRMTAVMDEQYNRRITATTEFTFSGPAAGSDLLKTGADDTGMRVLGTLNDCAGGVTPWGTFLAGEENFNQYFGNVELIADPVLKARAERYTFEEGPSERKWERFDPRFDLAQEPNEAHRFGWVVEVDPYDKASVPVKHTALGRMKHEGAEIRLAEDGRAVAYMGDDEVFDYVYKFVSDDAMMSGETARAREHNRTLLTKGTLYVAKFTGDSPPSEFEGFGQVPTDNRFDGSGEWIKIAAGDESFVDGMSAEEVYVFTREAGDKVGATKMDRPEDVEPNPVTGTVYLAMTNNTDRGKEGEAPPDEANPRYENDHGHVIELTEDDNDPTATSFAWSILLVCGDPNDPSTYFSGYDKSEVSPITSPDNVAFDSHGNLWIATDSGAALEVLNDGLYGVSLEGPTRGRTTLFASMPVGSEACGPVVTDEFVLICPQHPGDTDDGSIEEPASTWPDGEGSQPRPSVANIWKVGENGGPGKIGQ